MRIYDTFLFDGELSLLHHRLEELYPFVDCFVLIEAARTYRNQPKPLLFSEHREQFAWAAPKLRPVALQGLGGADQSARQRAALQRNALLLALRDAEPDDVILILDADEIPSPSLIQRLRAGGLAAPSRLAMTRHYEYLDTLAPRSPCCPSAEEPFPFATAAMRPGSWQALGETWYGRSGVAVRYRDLTGDPAAGIPPRTPFEMRFLNEHACVLPEAGRHLTSVDPAAHLERKIGRVFHEEYADDKGMSVPHLLRCRRYGVHHRGWWYSERPQGALPDDLERLSDRSPEMRAPASPGPRTLRRMVRSWAWIRLSPRLPARWVKWVDRHYESLLPLLALPLLTADLLRLAAARWACSRGRSARGINHAHHN